MTLEEASGDAVEIWPDNLLAVNVFIQMSTQWRTGMSGATGLDYNSLPVVMRLMGVPHSDRAETFECVRSMEDAALLQMQSNK
ncbi:DUF1799 domain-containing protein [Collimonas fungivorans]|uniref:DUF1799 domain-containing protein n=1 Tax=Collimonas fungivorans TaxID=158899 RepID=UPI0005A083C9